MDGANGDRCISISWSVYSWFAYQTSRWSLYQVFLVFFRTISHRNIVSYIFSQHFSHLFSHFSRSIFFVAICSREHCHEKVHDRALLHEITKKETKNKKGTENGTFHPNVNTAFFLKFLCRTVRCECAQKVPNCGLQSVVHSLQSAETGLESLSLMVSPKLNPFCVCVTLPSKLTHE